jgi:Protein of unknown function (DUF2934)
MSARKPGVTPRPDVALPIAVPTEAEVRAADLEQDESAVRLEQVQDREERIRAAAYAKYEKRGFTPGHDEEDWLEAERDIDQKKVEESETEDNRRLRPGP